MFRNVRSFNFFFFSLQLVSIVLNPFSGDNNLPVEVTSTRISQMGFPVQTENMDRGTLCTCVCMFVFVNVCCRGLTCFFRVPYPLLRLSELFEICSCKEEKWSVLRIWRAVCRMRLKEMKNTGTSNKKFITENDQESKLVPLTRWVKAGSNNVVKWRRKNFEVNWNYFLGDLATFRKVAVSFVISVCPNGKTRLLLDGLSWNWYLNIFRKYVEKIQVSFKSDNTYCTWRPIYIFDHISRFTS
jgi:hypothetical protein